MGYQGQANPGPEGAAMNALQQIDSVDNADKVKIEQALQAQLLAMS